MRRVIVIGSGGAGKSTFARRLAACTGLPLIHLDALYWKAGWVEPAKEEWAATVERLVAGERWVMDGNYGGTLDRRFAACDTVVFLDLPRTVCLRRVVGRWMKYRGRSRPDIAEGCPEQLSWEFVRWIWGYPATRRPGILQRLAALDAGQRVIILRTRAEVEDFFRDLTAHERT